MDREVNKITQVERNADSELVANHIQNIANRRNKRALAYALGLVLSFFGLVFYAYYSLQSASGTFKIQTSGQQKKIDSVPILDTNHYFDDRVALVQSGSTQNLTKLLTHTTISYLKRGELWAKMLTPNGQADLQANLDHFSIDHAMTNKDNLTVLRFKFSNGLPLVIKPHFSLGTPLEDIKDEEKRNSLEVIKWTLETEALVEISGNKKQTIKVRFNFDVLPTNMNYFASTLTIDRMSLWEVIQ